MGTEDYGTTIIKDMSQQGIEVFSIIKGEPGENFGEVAIGGTMELNLAVNTTLGFKCMDPAVTYDIVCSAHHLSALTSRSNYL